MKKIILIFIFLVPMSIISKMNKEEIKNFCKKINETSSLSLDILKEEVKLVKRNFKEEVSTLIIRRTMLKLNEMLAKKNGIPVHLIATEKMKTDFDFFKDVVLAGGNPEHANYLGQTSLMLAAAFGDLEFLEFVADLAVNPSVQDHNYDTPLMYAAVNDQPEVIRFLVTKFNLTSLPHNKWNQNALMLARMLNNHRVIDIIRDLLPSEN